MSLAEHLFELRAYAEAHPFWTVSNEVEAVLLMDAMMKRMDEFQRLLKIGDRVFGVTITYQEDEKIRLYTVTLIRHDDKGPVSDSIADHILSQGFDRATETFHRVQAPAGVNSRHFVLVIHKGSTVSAIRN